MCPLVLWGGLYVYYKKKNNIVTQSGFQATGFTQLSQPLATADQSGLYTPEQSVASPDWNTAAPSGGAASL
jgi:hypothetical protein